MTRDAKDKRIAELEELASMQRDSIHGLKTAVEKLLRRIQDAPKIDVWHRVDTGEIASAIESMQWYSGKWLPIQIRAIPVDPDHIPDVEKMPLELHEQSIKAVAE